ncbi:methionine aminopeptidase 2-like, partial [Ruditapes philippinarum]|uniref:methionine aminopeptidase 2-like n=1 Tax=Ruditapes philippinarum TaxID=129788 RepID=UPI00295C145F
MEKTTENETKTEFEEVKNDDSVKLEDTNAEDGETQKKKKKKRKKKKADDEGQQGEVNNISDKLENQNIIEGAEGETAEGEDGEKKKKKKKKKKGGANKQQTDPPSISIAELYSDGNFPEGEILDHPIAANDQTAKDRFSSEEKRALDRANTDLYQEVRLAAEAHRQTRQ